MLNIIQVLTKINIWKLSQSETEETQPKKKLTKQESVTYYTYEESFNPGVIDYGNDAAEVIDSFDWTIK